MILQRTGQWAYKAAQYQSDRFLGQLSRTSTAKIVFKKITDNSRMIIDTVKQ